MQLSEAEIALCGELSIDVNDVLAGTNTLFSQADIDRYINNGAKRAWSYKPWTFTEKTYKFTLTSDMLAAGYVDYPNTFEDESTFRLELPALGEFEKKVFADYQRWFALYPTSTDRIWTEHERFIFINAAAVSVGQEVDISGKLRAPTLVNATDLLPFSPTTDTQENSGNQAIVLFAYAEALASNKKGDTPGAQAQEARAMNILDVLWIPIGELRAQKNAIDRPFFETHDLFGNNRPNGSNRTNIGNFP